MNGPHVVPIGEAEAQHLRGTTIRRRAEKH
jgi:hypothetical protein